MSQIQTIYIKEIYLPSKSTKEEESFNVGDTVYLLNMSKDIFFTRKAKILEIVMIHGVECYKLEMENNELDESVDYKLLSEEKLVDYLKGWVAIKDLLLESRK